MKPRRAASPGRARYLPYWPNACEYSLRAVLAGTALLGIGLDQATKVLLVTTLEGKPPIRVVGQVLTIYVSRNSGAAFGFAPAATVLFT